MKNGIQMQDMASVAAESSPGHWVKPGDHIPVGLLNPDAEGRIVLYIEALDEPSSQMGDIRIKARLHPAPDAPAYESLTDTVRATIFDVQSVRPDAGDFVQDHEGRIMISTKHCTTNTPLRVYTSGITTISNTPAQHHNPDGSHDRRVTATAYVVPIPPTNYPPVTVYFEVIDPDDLSPYDGKLHPTNSTNRLPNDNRDPLRRMWWDEAGNPAGYSELQQSPYLSFRSRTATHVPIDGIERYAAETKLLPTGRYAGDNYQVRATLRAPDYSNEGGRFDTHTGMNTNNVPYTFHASMIRETTPLVAWKRVYIEQDNMYTQGATIVSNAPPGATELYVDNSVDFIGSTTNITVFWKDAGQILSFDTVVSQWLTDTSIAVPETPQLIPAYAGIKPQGHTATYELTGQYLPQAFGECPEGTDGGAFIEFRPAPTGNDGGVPKYRWMPSPQDSDNTLAYGYYIDMWFDHRLQAWLYAGNVLYLHSGDRGYDNQGQLQGWHSVLHGSSIVFTQNGQVDATFREKAVVHEIGHRFGLSKNVGGAYSYIDYNTGKKSYSGDAYCIMNYRSLAASNATHAVEFSIEALLEGSHPGTNNSLRTVSDW